MEYCALQSGHTHLVWSFYLYTTLEGDLDLNTMSENNSLFVHAQSLTPDHGFNYGSSSLFKVIKGI